MHVTVADEKREILDNFECASCKYTWQDEECVVEHIIENMRTYFCLNCDDWVKQKTNVLKVGWTLLDEDGHLRADV